MYLLPDARTPFGKPPGQNTRIADSMLFNIEQV
jgi:hypothetical protein